MARWGGAARGVLPSCSEAVEEYDNVLKGGVDPEAKVGLHGVDAVPGRAPPVCP